VGDGFYAGYVEGWPTVEDPAHPRHLYPRVFEGRGGNFYGREACCIDFERDWGHNGMARQYCGGITVPSLSAMLWIGGPMAVE
jgi:hypothetical protein